MSKVFCHAINYPKSFLSPASTNALWDRLHIMIIISLMLASMSFPTSGHVADIGHVSTEDSSAVPVESDEFRAIPFVVSSDARMTILDIEIDIKRENFRFHDAPVSVGLVAVAPQGSIVADVLSVQAYPLQDYSSTVSLSVIDHHSDLVVLETPAVWRELRVVSIHVNPFFRYDGIMYGLKSTRIAIVNHGGEGEGEKLLPIRPISPVWERIYESNILNFKFLDIPRLRGGTGNRYIIISRHRFNYQTPQLIEWKTRQGYGIVHKTLEELGYSDPTEPDAIEATKRFIMEAYTSWPVPPEFVILVGDMFSEISSGSIYTKLFNDMMTYAYYDQWYALLDGPDLFPDVMLGRFPDTNVIRLNYMLHKSIDYEMNPYIEEDWQKNAVMTGLHHNDPDHITMQTKREIADSLAAWGMNVEELYQENANPANLLPLINQGLTFYNYRGDECMDDDWGGTFHENDVQYISNAHKLGIWTIISCHSAYVGSSQRSTAEALLRHGFSDPLNPQGAVAFVGSQGNSWYLYNNALDEGFYRAFTSEGATILGEAFMSGKAWAYANTQSGDHKDVMMKEYTILGDPSLQVWTETPSPMNVMWNHTSIPPDVEIDVCIIVSDSISMEPIENALVCLYRSDDVFVYGYTDDSGAVSLSILADSADLDQPINVTATAFNRMPFLGQIPVVRAVLHPPEGLDIRMNDEGSAILSWAPAQGFVAEYHIYMTDTPHESVSRERLVSTTQRTTCVLPIDINGSSSFYHVKALMQNGVCTPPSMAIGMVHTDLSNSGPSKTLMRRISNFLRRKKQ